MFMYLKNLNIHILYTIIQFYTHTTIESFIFNRINVINTYIFLRIPYNVRKRFIKQCYNKTRVNKKS